MRKIINGKLYDTDTAKEHGSDSFSNCRDFHYWHEILYQKRTGEFFLYGEGGPLSRYAESTGNNSWSGSQKIIPLSYNSARKWAEEHLSADEYAEVFGMPSEDAEPVVLNIQLDAALMARIRDRAASNGITLTACVSELLENGLK